MNTVGTTSVTAILTGGPVTIPSALRVRDIDPQDEKIKLPHYGGYEHFERTANLVGDDACLRIIYQWTMRTEVAE
jgi:hypothetical protein